MIVHSIFLLPIGPYIQEVSRLTIEDSRFHTYTVRVFELDRMTATRMADTSREPIMARVHHLGFTPKTKYIQKHLEILE